MNRNWWVATVIQGLTRLGLVKVTEAGWARKLGKWVLGRQEEIRVIEVVRGLGKGLKLRALPETPRTYVLGTHEPDLQRVAEETVRSGDVVYDCGANIGYFSGIFSRLVGPEGKVIALEPSLGSYESLCQVGPLNGLGNIQALHAAVWSENGELHLEGEAGKSLVSDRVVAQGTGAPVPALSLDSLVFDRGYPPPTVIKMDVEGAEGEALQGARRVLSTFRPVLLLEIHGEPGRKAWEVLQELGFESRDLVTGKVPLSVDEFAVWIRQYRVTPPRETKPAKSGTGN